jgi:hypothetical protein
MREAIPPLLQYVFVALSTGTNLPFLLPSLPYEYDCSLMPVKWNRYSVTFSNFMQNICGFSRMGISSSYYGIIKQKQSLA